MWVPSKDHFKGTMLDVQPLKWPGTTSRPKVNLRRGIIQDHFRMADCQLKLRRSCVMPQDNDPNHLKD
ncbi:hypothetical protein MHYP_G00105160 [Metynnis hypsauchen]